MKPLKINWILSLNIIVLLLTFHYIWEDRTSVLIEVLLCPSRETFFVSTGGLTDVQLVINLYEGHLESKERFAIKKYLLIIGKKKNMQVLSHTFTYFST